MQRQSSVKCAGTCPVRPLIVQVNYFRVARYPGTIPRAPLIGCEGGHFYVCPATRPTDNAVSKPLFHYDRDKLIALDANFNSEGRTDAVALYDSPANPRTTQCLRHLQRIENGAATRIAHHRMVRLVAVIGRKLPKISYVLELTAP